MPLYMLNTLLQEIYIDPDFDFCLMNMVNLEGARIWEYKEEKTDIEWKSMVKLMLKIMV